MDDHTQSDPIMNSLNELTAYIYGNNNPNITYCNKNGASNAVYQRELQEKISIFTYKNFLSNAVKKKHPNLTIIWSNTEKTSGILILYIYMMVWIKLFNNNLTKLRSLKSSKPFSGEQPVDLKQSDNIITEYENEFLKRLITIDYVYHTNNWEYDYHNHLLRTFGLGYKKGPFVKDDYSDTWSSLFESQVKIPDDWSKLVPIDSSKSDSKKVMWYKSDKAQIWRSKSDELASKFKDKFSNSDEDYKQYELLVNTIGTISNKPYIDSSDNLVLEKAYRDSAEIMQRMIKRMYPDNNVSEFDAFFDNEDKHNKNINVMIDDIDKSILQIKTLIKKAKMKQDFTPDLKGGETANIVNNKIN